MSSQKDLDKKTTGSHVRIVKTNQLEVLNFMIMLLLYFKELDQETE
jgi:hypothetical protein